MNWLDVAKLVAPFAPALGGILGGFIPIPGGGLVGQEVGAIIARQFGVPATPDAVNAAIAASPNELAIARLNASMEEARARWPAIAEMEKAWAQTQATAITQVNETIRAELGHENWYFNGWRPMAGWLFCIFATIDGLMLVAAVVVAGFGPHVLLDVVKDVQFMAIGHLGALAATVGVYIIGRSQEKTKAIETAPITRPAPVVVTPARRPGTTGL